MGDDHSDLHAYRWYRDDAGTWSGADLNDLISPLCDCTLTEAHDVSSAGWIVGDGFVNVPGFGARTHGFLLKPITCPGDIDGRVPSAPEILGFFSESGRGGVPRRRVPPTSIETERLTEGTLDFFSMRGAVPANAGSAAAPIVVRPKANHRQKRTLRPSDCSSKGSRFSGLIHSMSSTRGGAHDRTPTLYKRSIGCTSISPRGTN